MAAYPAVAYFRVGLHEFYMIDLNCLPERLSPMVNFTHENSPGWTVIDECIYFVGGMEWMDLLSFTVGEILHKCNTTTNPDSSSSSSSSSSWVPISPKRKLHWFNPFVFDLDGKIYVVGGHNLRNGYKFEEEEDYKFEEKFEEEEDYKFEENADWAHWGEYFNFDSQKWHLLPPAGIDDLSNFLTALTVDKTTLVFYSVHDGNLVLYDVRKEECVHMEHHFDLELSHMVVREGLEGCRSLYALLYVASHTCPVVCDSTLYWLNNDLCLYGYDYVRKRWFQSNSLQGELDWSLSVYEDCLIDMPLLLYLDNGTFLAICATGDKELEIALIAVKRDLVSLKVSLNFSQKFPVDTSESSIFLFNGMTIRKEGSMLGKRKSASED